MFFLIMYTFTDLSQIGDDLEYLLGMMKELQEQYKKRDQEKWGVLCPRVGMICVAKFELDQQWYRAQIIGRYQSKMGCLVSHVGNIYV